MNKTNILNLWAQLGTELGLDSRKIRSIIEAGAEATQTGEPSKYRTRYTYDDAKIAEMLKAGNSVAGISKLLNIPHPNLRAHLILKGLVKLGTAKSGRPCTSLQTLTQARLKEAGERNHWNINAMCRELNFGHRTVVAAIVTRGFIKTETGYALPAPIVKAEVVTNKPAPDLKAAITQTLVQAKKALVARDLYQQVSVQCSKTTFDKTLKALRTAGTVKRAANQETGRFHYSVAK